MTATPVINTPPEISLVNPVKEHFEAFIFGNALKCEQVARQNSAIGQTIVICGAGPSLAPHAAKWTARGDQVWGCNSAMPWLLAHGHKCTHGFTIDQTPHMVDEWFDVPDVNYLVASSIHPHLTELLLARGRSLTFFHNYCGIDKPPVAICATCDHDHPDGACLVESCSCLVYEKTTVLYEDWLYMGLYPGTVRCGSGLNSVTRAIDLALYVGAERVVVLGADCAIQMTAPRPSGAYRGSLAERRWLKDHTVMHADGGDALASGATATTLEGVIDGRVWLTKPDMIISAVWMEKWRRSLGRKKLTFIGDTLPNALQGKDDAFLARLPALVTSDGHVMSFE